MMLLLLACAPTPPGEVRFLRGAVRNADGSVVERAWSPGEVVDGVTAPRLPECVSLFHVELERMDRLAAAGAPPPGAALAFSPDGRQLAIGSDAGSLRVVDGWTGEERARRRLAEGAVKRLAWSPDGGTLYVGEQSPDALLLAVDPASLTTRWSVRLADELGTSTPAAGDPYALYSLPSAFSIEVLADGSLLVAGAHGWTDADAVRRNLTRLYHYDADGRRLAAWPPEGPADAILLHPEARGDRVLVGLSRSADGPDPPLPIGGVVLLGLPTLKPAWQRVFPPLEPHFHSVFVWQALGLGEGFGFVGFGDGRVFVLDEAGEVTRTLTPGVPLLASGVPIAVGVGFGAASQDAAWFVTTGTTIPWGSADPSTRPPAAHPAQNTVHAVHRDGSPRWSRAFEHALQGLALSPDGRWLAVGAAGRDTDSRTDLFGALVLDPTDGALVTACPTRAPVHFNLAWAPDSGRFALAEAPFLHGGVVTGSYRVTVVR